MVLGILLHHLPTCLFWNCIKITNYYHFPADFKVITCILSLQRQVEGFSRRVSNLQNTGSNSALNTKKPSTPILKQTIKMDRPLPPSSPVESRQKKPKMEPVAPPPKIETKQDRPVVDVRKASGEAKSNKKKDKEKSPELTEKVIIQCADKNKTQYVFILN